MAGEKDSRDLLAVADEASRTSLTTITSSSYELGQPNEELEIDTRGDTIDEEEEEEEIDMRHEERRVLPSVFSLLLSSPQNFSFFIAVALSGMGCGVIDTFLFIR